MHEASVTCSDVSFLTLSHVLRRCQGFTWDVFNGGFGLLNRWGVRKPVFNAFKLLNEAGNERWNVSGIDLDVRRMTLPAMLAPWMRSCT